MSGVLNNLTFSSTKLYNNRVRKTKIKLYLIKDQIIYFIIFKHLYNIL